MKNTCIVAAALVALPGLAFADFEIEDATTEENAVEFEISNSIFIGDVNNGEDASRHEIGIAWGVLNPWTTELSFEFSVPRGARPASMASSGPTPSVWSVAKPA